MNKTTGSAPQTGLEIAIIGMSGRFPGARNTQEYWENLENGVESITFYSDEHLEATGVNPQALENPDYVKSGGGRLENPYHFDSSFFGYIVAEAEVMDPQIRLFHEEVWAALEDSGYGPASYKGLIGLYAGGFINLNWEAAAMLSGKSSALGSFDAGNLSNKDFICATVSYKLNLKGPSLSVQTACSTSLVAIHIACRALLTKECDIALSGGAAVKSGLRQGYMYQEGMIGSSDGHCRAFDHRATGTAAGSAVGVVVLKRLKRAVADRDNIYAVIKGTAINNDGIRKAGFTAPSIEGQADVIKMAQHISGVHPETITYVETHGTGTIIGDPIEIEGLKLAFNTPKTGYCAIGSVKTNIGHTDSAAGVSGLIKTALALKHKLIPASLNYEAPNPKIDFQNSPFFVNDKPRQWKRNGSPLRAGVSAFGIGGTNAHAIVEEAPQPQPSSQSRACQMIMLSAKTPTALEKMTANLADYLKTHPQTPLADIAYTLQAGRDRLDFRKVAVCTDTTGLIEALETPASDHVQSFGSREKTMSVVFMFPGQGAQYVRMGRDLYQREQFFREEMDRCFSLLQPMVDFNLKEILYSDSPDSPVSPDSQVPKEEAPDAPVNQTQVAQPLLFILEYSLARLLMKWGITPNAMTGHSIGEYTAACLSGVFSLEDALRLVCARGRLMQQMPAGAMLSVPLSPDQLEPLLTDDVALAAVNGPSRCVVSGTFDAIDRFNQLLTSKGIEGRKLHTSHAFHSDMMDPILEPFNNEVRQVRLKEPGIPFISNRTGLPITPEDAVDPSYWSRHIRATVNFHGGLKHLLETDNTLFIEVGPGNVLSTFTRGHEDKRDSHFIVNLLRHPNDDTPDDRYLFNKIGLSWLYGGILDWQPFYAGETRNRVPLPTYPFEGREYVLDTNLSSYNAQWRNRPALTKNGDVGQWFYIPSWKRTRFPSQSQPGESENKCCLIFLDPYGIGAQIATQLRDRQQDVVTVEMAGSFNKEDHHRYQLDPADDDSWERLFSQLEKDGKIPGRVIHLWSMSDVTPDTTPDDHGDDPLTPERFQRAQAPGYYSLLNIAIQLGNFIAGDNVDFQVVTSHLLEVNGDEALCPEKATLLSPVKVIPQENPSIRCRCIDIQLPQPDEENSPKNSPNAAPNATPQLIPRLLDEAGADPSETIVAYRGNHRWVQVYEQLQPAEPAAIPPLLREKGVYIIIGGLGNIGFNLAQHLARQLQARLILTGRSPFPGRDQWDQWISDHEETNLIRQKIETIRQMEDAGAQVSVARVDVADKEEMVGVIDEAVQRWGKLNGLFHSAAGLDGRMTVINQMEKKHSDSQFHSKVNGLLVLREILARRDIDFCLLMSSLSCILGGISLAPYSAANLFMDAFVQWHNRGGGPPWLSPNWDGWNFWGQAPGSSMDAFAMTPEEGMKAFQYLLSDAREPLARVVVSTGDLQVRLRQWTGADTQEEEEETQTQTLHPRPQLTKPYVAPSNEMEVQLAEIWKDFFRIDEVGIHDDFFELGGDSLKGMRLVNQYKKLLGEMVYIQVVFESPTIAQLAEFFTRNYDSAARIMGLEVKEESGEAPVDEEMLTRLRRMVPAALPLPRGVTRKNRRAVFILSSSRAGSTLLRVVLGGHSKLFAPPELYLLWVNELKQLGIGREGLVRAVMQLKDCGPEEAKETVAQMEDQPMTSFQIYGQMQEWMGDRMLVEKTPSYAFSVDVMRRVEAFFEDPLYINLIRHPYGMINSRGEAKLDLPMGLLHNPPFGPRQFAEMEWILCYRNILEFLNEIPPHRRHRIIFEELVRNPREIVDRMCRFLEIEPEPDMLHPYDDKKKRMTDGIYEVGVMLGDPRFHEHTGIDPAIADKWKDKIKTDFLGDIAWEMAESFGYQRLQKKPSPGFHHLQPAEMKDYYPLSSPQKRLYIFQQLDPNQVTYNLPYVLHIAQGTDAAGIEAVFRQLIQRHESLRTSFQMVGEEPMQRVYPDVEFNLEKHTVPPGSMDVGLKALTDAAASRFVRPFDLHKAPLFRVGIIETGAEYDILVFDMHHIIKDATSHGILNHELFALMKGDRLPPLTIQYKDYCQWLNSAENRDMRKAQETFWTDMFAGELPVLQLPADHPRPMYQQFHGGNVAFVLEKEELTLLKEACKKSESTVFMVLLAVFNMFLAKISGQEDITVGIPIAGRRHPDLEPIVGMFVNTLALRNFPEPRKTCGQFLSEIRGRTLKAFENQEYPFEDLIDRIDVKRDLSRNPVFDVMFLFQNVQADTGGTRDRGERAGGGERSNNDGESSGSPIASYNFTIPVSKFDLTLNVMDSGSSYFWNIEYATSLFTAETVQRMVRYLKTVISTGLADLDRSIGDITLVTEEDKQELLVRLNDTRRDYPRDKTLHGLFAEQVDRHPGRIALTAPAGEHTPSGTAALTYGQLDTLARRLAFRLNRWGIDNEKTVLLMVEHSLEMAIGILGILEAGGAYLPLEPGYPSGRVGYILADSGADALLTTGPPPDDIHVSHHFRLCKEELELLPQTREGTGTGAEGISPTSARNLAYVIYTSGTTGAPKGVPVEHRSAVRLVKNTNYIQFETGDRLLQTCSVMFDVSVFEVWGTLLNGLTMVSERRESIPDPRILRSVIERQDISVMWLTTSLFNHVLEADTGIFATLRCLLVGGEALSPPHINRIVKEYPRLKVLNGYGPTENCSFSTSFDIDKEYPESIPIGAPISNSSAYVVGADGHLQPPGIAGELYLGGDGLARGYLNAPELTSRRFISGSSLLTSGPWPPESTLYRTGDYARWMPDGNLIFLGRLDNQVKVRGYRIELGEIRHRLLAHPEVTDAVVVVHGDAAGGKDLAAYIVAKEPLEIPELRTLLARRLPEYMIPPYFEFLDRIPLTPNGKLDRRALPRPEGEAQIQYAAPENEIQTQLVEIWAEILAVDPAVIGIHDNFFHRGGHSLKATVMTARLEKIFGVHLPLAEVLKAPTISEISALLEVVDWAHDNPDEDGPEDEDQSMEITI
ncbi:MAG: amino acid adenylation domain-containing protein [bacterium]|nr:amino acid adenylation domain-containing protein [bacterium]